MASRALPHDPEPEATMHFASLEPVRLGMPELCRAGLSENWLWKACGHRHWLALAAAHGLDRPDFRSVAGERLYPAFVRVTLCDARLDTAREHDRFDFDLRLERCSPMRFASEIAVTAGGCTIAKVRMESVFLRRTIAGSNLSAARAVVARPCGLLVPTTRPPRQSDLPHAEAVVAHRHTVEPNPWEDFNGADFLYFASFQTIIDRAEWAWSDHTDPLWITRNRDIHYLGNVELGDRVEVITYDAARSGDVLTYRTELRRVSDGQVIATARTDRIASYREAPECIAPPRST